MKMTWKNKSKAAKRPFSAISTYPNLPFDQQQQQQQQQPDTDPALEDPRHNNPTASSSKTLAPDEDDPKALALSFQAQGDQLAQDGKYREALGKWEAALTLMPESAVLYEQKAQVLLELGDAWSALKAATRSTELEPSWPEAWITLGRAQLNFGEPDSAIESFGKALALKPDCVETQEDRKTALNLVKRRKQLHLSGLSTAQNRFVVGDKTESS